MAINIINFSNGYSSSGMALISEETRRRLIALGIDPAIVTSESHARTLIERAEKAQKIENSQNNLQNNTNITTQENNIKIETLYLTMDYNAVMNKMLLGL